MNHKIFAVLLFIAMILFGYAGGLFAGWWEFGNAWVVMSLAFIAVTAAQYHLCGHPTLD